MSTKLILEFVASRDGKMAEWRKDAGRDTPCLLASGVLVPVVDSDGFVDTELAWYVDGLRKPDPEESWYTGSPSAVVALLSSVCESSIEIVGAEELEDLKRACCFLDCPGFFGVLVFDTGTELCV